MRSTMSLLCCIALVAACGSPGGEQAATAHDEDAAAGAEVSAGEAGTEAAVVAQLNDMCEENWCAGEFDYEFLTLECGESTCELFFRAERGGQAIEDSVVFDYDEPLLYEGELEAGYWERINDAISDEWEPAQGPG